MKTYICDRCGFKEEFSEGIIGNEFDYKNFKTLIKQFRTNGIVDVCNECFKEIQDAYYKAEKEVNTSIFDRVKNIVRVNPTEARR